MVDVLLDHDDPIKIVYFICCIVHSAVTLAFVPLDVLFYLCRIVLRLFASGRPKRDVLLEYFDQVVVSLALGLMVLELLLEAVIALVQIVFLLIGIAYFQVIFQLRAIQLFVLGPVRLRGGQRLIFHRLSFF
ncbi:hypothetical protein ACJ41O_009371 [Fusarium nematophilum]